MNIKDKEGSMMIGIILIIAMLAPLFLFGYEVSLMYLIKGRIDSHATNISSTIAISSIDEDELYQGRIALDEEKVAERVSETLKEGFKGNQVINIEDVDVSTYKDGDKLIFNTTVKSRLLENFKFFKGSEIKSNGIIKVYFKNEIDSEDIEFMTIKDMHNNIMFEVM